ncbi:uncharacterized protein [Rutidosis leptorrhynchoides]|uniref:uncharacterized protein n=1 Tax=Rutidosis leptorrhynchoides TaxID=125765 RepID=UPI003A99244D
MINLRYELSEVVLYDVHDYLKWAFISDKLFSVKYAMDQLDPIFLSPLPCLTIWRKFLPEKVNIFLWRFAIDRLSHRLNLSRRGLQIESNSYVVCKQGVKSLHHTFFLCSLATAVWQGISTWINLPIPSFASWQNIKFD